jgi:hypothetical protein
MNDLGSAIVTLVVLGMLFVLSIWVGVWLFTDTEVRSKNIIKPTIELEINNNKVDTIYIYTQK